jgi:hypothetical protein
MNDILFIILSGIYTLAYVIVIIIQSNHIKKLKEAEEAMISSNGLMEAANKTMKSYVEIYDVEKVKRYVEMNEETIRLEAANFVADSEKLKNFAYEIMKEQTESVREFYIEEMGKEHMELFNMVLNLLWQNRNNPNNYNSILNNLPKTKDRFLGIISKLSEGQSNKLELND